VCVCVCVCVRARARVCVLYVASLHVASVPEEDLEAVKPKKNSSVIILSLLSPSLPPSIALLHSVCHPPQGELKGNTGKLIGIDGRDGIVKMDMNQDIKIVDMPSLAVYRND